MHITIVDNNQSISRLLMEFLHEKDHVLSFAPNMAGAVLLIYSQRPNLIFIDPEIDEKGPLLFECVYPRFTKTVLMTTNSKLHHSIHADFYLDKPFDLSDIEKILEIVQK